MWPCFVTFHLPLSADSTTERNPVPLSLHLCSHLFSVRAQKRSFCVKKFCLHFAQRLPQPNYSYRPLVLKCALASLLIHPGLSYKFWVSLDSKITRLMLRDLEKSHMTSLNTHTVDRSALVSPVTSSLRARAGARSLIVERKPILRSFCRPNVCLNETLRVSFRVASYIAKKRHMLSGRRRNIQRPTRRSWRTQGTAFKMSPCFSHR